MRRRSLPLILSLAMMVFLYVPIIMLVISSFNPSRFGAAWTTFSLKWYRQLFSNRELWEAMSNSLIIAITSTTTATVIGTASAWALHRYRSALQRVHYALVYAPLIIPDLLVGISLLIFFICIRLQLGLTSIFLAHTTFCISYVALVILARLKNFDMSLLEAAQDLGAGWRQTFGKVILPTLRPAIISAALLAFTLSIDDFIITYFVAGPGATTLPLYIYGQMKYGSTPMINALSTLMLLMTAVLVYFSQRFSKDEVA